MEMRFLDFRRLMYDGVLPNCLQICSLNESERWEAICLA